MRASICASLNYVYLNLFLLEQFFCYNGEQLDTSDFGVERVKSALQSLDEHAVNFITISLGLQVYNYLRHIIHHVHERSIPWCILLNYSTDPTFLKTQARDTQFNVI
jgi:hypothetical protein